MYLEFQPDGGGAEGCTAIEIRSIGVTNNWFDIPCAAKTTNLFICSKEATQRGKIFHEHSEPLDESKLILK